MFWKKKNTTLPPKAGETIAPSNVAQQLGGGAAPAPKGGVSKGLVVSGIVGLAAVMLIAKFVSDLRAGTFSNDGQRKQGERKVVEPVNPKEALIEAQREGRKIEDQRKGNKALSDEQLSAAINAPASMTTTEAVAAAKNATQIPNANNGGAIASGSAAPVVETTASRVIDGSGETPNSLSTDRYRSRPSDTVPPPSGVKGSTLRPQPGARASSGGHEDDELRQAKLAEEKRMFDLRSSALLVPGSIDRPAARLASDSGAIGQRLPAEASSASQAKDPVQSFLEMMSSGAQVSAQSSGGRQTTFVERQRADGSKNEVSFSRPAIQGTVVLPGSHLKLVTQTTIRSDLEGDVVAITSEDLFDSVDSRRLVVPKGSRLIGSSSSDLTPGQERAFAAFKTLYFPDGRSFDLKAAAASDLAGATGLPADVDRRLLRKFGAGLLLAGITYAIDRKNPNNQTVIVNGQPTEPRATLSSEAAKVIGQTTSRYIESQQSVPDLLTVPAGTPFSIIVRAPMVLIPNL